MTDQERDRIDPSKLGRQAVEIQRKSDDARRIGKTELVNVIPPAHLGNGRIARGVGQFTVHERRAVLTRMRRLRLLGLSIASAGIFMLLTVILFAIGASHGFEWGTAWSVVSMTLGIGAFVSGIGAVQSLPRIFFRAAVPAIDGDDTDRLAKASDRMTKLLLNPEMGEVDAELVKQASIVVDALTKMSKVPLRNQGMHGYPPDHTTGENAVNHENDTMSAHVARIRKSMSALLDHARGKEAIPSTVGEIQAIIGGVAAPLRVALRRHGIRIGGLDDGRGFTPRPVTTFMTPLPPTPPREVTDQIGAIIGHSEGLAAIRRQRERIRRIGVNTLEPDLAIEARTLLDRHLPALLSQVAAAHAAAENGLDESTVAEAEAMLVTVADGLRAIADSHAAVVRNKISDQRRFLDSRETRDPLGG